MKGIRRSSMLEDVPLQFSDKVVVDSCSSSKERLSPNAPLKQGVIYDIATKALFIAPMISIFLVADSILILRTNTPSRVALLNEIDRLEHNLESYKILKKKYQDEEVQLNWDKRHIKESESIVQTMLTKSQEVKERSYSEERAIKEETKHMQDDLHRDINANNMAAQHNSEAVHDLKKEIQRIQHEIKLEQDETVALRRQIAQTMTNLSHKNISLPEHLHDRLNSLEYSVWLH